MIGSDIGFIGTGTIGKPMASKVMDAYPGMLVFDIDTTATRALVERGAKRVESIAELAKSCSLVFTSLPGPPQIEAVMLGAEGLLENADKLRTIVDLSTNSLQLNRDVAEFGKTKNVDFLDAPVSGGKIAAEKGTLAVMVGGDRSSFDAVRPVLECFGEHISYMGPSGSGTLTKLVNNQIFLCASVLIQEGFVMGAKAGMDPSALLTVLKASSAAPIVTRASLVLSRDFNMDVFALAIAAKDVAVALESAREIGASMPMTEAASEVYQQALDLGLGSEDFFATVKVLEQAAAVELPPLQISKDR